MVLLDTSVWIDHLRRGNIRAAALLGAGDVACHPLVIGELACGGLNPDKSRSPGLECRYEHQHTSTLCPPPLPRALRRGDDRCRGCDCGGRCHDA